MFHGNDIRLLHYTNTPVGPNDPFVVKFIENQWQRQDGQRTGREHLLMALANLDHILIRATFGEGLEDISTFNRKMSNHLIKRLIVFRIGNVTMDVAGGRDSGLPRASSVEQCSCPLGYKGLSCEKCSPGYTRSSEGLYLGLCQPCQCYGYANTCDPDNGVCIGCRDGTTGAYCDRCEQGYEGDPTRGVPCTRSSEGGLTCSCDPRGSLSQECDNYQCDCKANVEGSNCNRCRSGTFDLDASNPIGCSECWCAGVTNECFEAPLYWSTLRVLPTDNEHGVTLKDMARREDFSRDIQYENGEVHYKYASESDKPLYWSLPAQFIGNKIESYGGNLTINQRYGGSGDVLDLADVIMVGNGVALHWKNPDLSSWTPDERMSLSLKNKVGYRTPLGYQLVYSKRRLTWIGCKIEKRSLVRPFKETVLSLRERGWIRVQGGVPSEATKDDFLTALSNLDVILIRATILEYTSQTSLRKVTMNVAVQQDTGFPSTGIEECQCPVGYHGNSCQECAVGYYRDPSDRSEGSLGRCTPCRCSGNEQECSLDSEGVLQCTCQPGYSGPRCESVVKSQPPQFHLTQFLQLTQFHELQEKIKDHIFAVSEAGEDQGMVQVIVLEPNVPRAPYPAQPDYGRPEYERPEYGRPYGRPDYGRPEDRPEYNGPGERPDYGRPDERPSYNRPDERPNYNRPDERPNYNRPDERPDYGRPNYGQTGGVEVSQEQFEGPLGGNAELRCLVTGNMSDIKQQWLRSNNQRLPSGSYERGGTLYLRDLMREDGGQYTCQGVDSSNRVLFRATTNLLVTGWLVGLLTADSFLIAPPRIILDPAKQVVNLGEDARIACVATGDQPIEIKWTKQNGRLPQSVMVQGGIMEFRGISPSDQGKYVCLAANKAGRAEAVAEVIVQDDLVRITWLEAVLYSPEGKVVNDPLYTFNFDDELERETGSGSKSDNAEGSGEMDDWDHGNRDNEYSYEVGDQFTAREGSSIDLRCRLDTSNGRYLTWNKENGYIPRQAIEMQDGVLRIPNVLPSDSGRYICSNNQERQYLPRGDSGDPYGDDGSYASYPSYGSPSTDPQALTRPKVKCTENEFRCLKREECINIAFVCDGEIDCTDGSDETSCRNRRSAFTQAEVEIQSNRNKVFEGDDLELRCSLVGDSTGAEGRVSWTKLNSFLSSNVQDMGSVLRFTKLQEDDTGTYQCTIYTSQGNMFQQNFELDASLTIPRVSSDDAGIYICKANNSEHDIEQSVALVVTQVLPHFSQAPLSYMELPTLPDAYLNLDLEISFKPELANGVIFYNGHDERGGKDFISLSLRNGKPELRYNLGHETAILTAPTPITFGKWHTVKISRSRKNATLVIDDNIPIRGSAKGRFDGLDLMTPLYLGGVPFHINVEKVTDLNNGFKGCIGRFVIGTQALVLSPASLKSKGVESCDSCSMGPCENDGICQASANDQGYRCLCLPGFSGEHCKREGEMCFEGACNGGRCKNTVKDFECLCPFGQEGRFCEDAVNINRPAFSGNSYLATNRPKHILRQLKLSFKFRALDTRDSVLIYSAQSDDGHGDFASVTLKDEHLEFRFNTGSGTAILKSPEPIQVKKWYKVVLNRKLKHGQLLVVGQTPVRAESPGSTRGLNIRTPLYFGGVKRDHFTLAPGVGAELGFIGCITDIRSGKYELDLLKTVIDSANIRDCSSTESKCDESPCENGSTCTPGKSKDKYLCVCQEGFKGQNCQLKTTQCDNLEPCRNGGRCEGGTEFYKCFCPLGFGGRNCDKKLSVDGADSLGFRGDSFMELDWKLLPHFDPTKIETIEMEFSTTKAEGLLFYQDGPQMQIKDRDFLAMSIANGFPRFEFNLGEGSAELKGDKKVNDGKLHRIKIIRRGRKGSIEIDGGDITKGSSKGFTGRLDTDGNIFVGGAIKPSQLTHGRYVYGFRGCLHRLVVQGREIDFLKDPVSTGNLVPCSSTRNSEQVNEMSVVSKHDYEDPYTKALRKEMEEFDEDKYLERMNRVG
eukprot:TCALIF_07549-PA protein Name:"Similar to HSPG2 Basement membrane-specific heparan sulfate proteoglycan core protein (Homo sapiens)" AED:0.37 eAED:0.38 QI:0/0.3/0.22/0.87/0.7/0.67/31/0/1988